MKTRERKLSPKEQAAAKKKYGKSRSLADEGRAYLGAPVGSKPKPKPKKSDEPKRKKRKAEELVSDNSIAQQMRKNLDPEARIGRALNPTRQRKAPQYGPGRQD